MSARRMIGTILLIAAIRIANNPAFRHKWSRAAPKPFVLTYVTFIIYLKSMEKDYLRSPVKLKFSETIKNIMFVIYFINHGYDLGSIIHVLMLF